MKIKKNYWIDKNVDIEFKIKCIYEGKNASKVIERLQKAYIRNEISV